MRIESVRSAPKLLVRLMSHVYQAPSQEELIPISQRSVLDYQRSDLERQIGQGQELLASGKSQYPEQLRAQLVALEGQRTKLL